MVDFFLSSKWSGKLSSIVSKLIKNIADKKAVDALIPILKENRDISRFYESLTSLMIYNPHSVDLYLDSSIDKDYFVRYMAAKALVNIGTAPAINALINVLENGDETNREIAANVLGDSRSESVISVLVNAEMDSNETVRKAAQKSLMKLESTEL